MLLKYTEEVRVHPSTGTRYHVLDIENTIVHESDIATCFNILPRHVRRANPGEMLTADLDSSIPQYANGGELIFTMHIATPDGNTIIDTYPAFDFSSKPPRAWSDEDLHDKYDLEDGDLGSDEGAIFIAKPVPTEFVPNAVQQPTALVFSDNNVQLLATGSAFRISRSLNGVPVVAGGVNKIAFDQIWFIQPFREILADETKPTLKL